MRNTILKHKIDWIDKMNIESDSYYVQQWLDKLDQEMISFEARWGVGVLPQVASPELQEKWNKQMDKLNTAILTNDIHTIEDLVTGTIRGLKALEQYAFNNSKAKRHAPPAAWTVRMPNGQQLAIVENNIQAGHIQSITGLNQDTVVYTLEEIANIISKQNLCDVITERQKTEPAKKQTQKFDFKKGDSVPW